MPRAGSAKATGSAVRKSGIFENEGKLFSRNIDADYGMSAQEIPIIPEDIEESRRVLTEYEEALQYDECDYSEETVGAPALGAFPTEKESLDDRLLHLDKTFQQYLFMLIDRRGLSDPDVYKKANIDRKHFSKIRSNVDYMPSKKTALALALALELSLDETKDLLARAGLALSPSMMSDRIIEYCIETKNYNIYDINCILFEYDQPTLGA